MRGLHRRRSRAAAPPPTHPRLAYAHLSQRQRLDLWLPPSGPRPAPLVVFVHGGAFAYGDASMAASKVDPLLRAGFAVAAVEYRLSGEALFPAAPQDVRAAVRYLRAHAAGYGVDPDAVALWGESAGGNLAALLGVTGDRVTVLDRDVGSAPATAPAPVQAVVDWYGPTDFLLMDAHAAAGPCRRPMRHDAPDSPESRYLGAPVQTVPDLARQCDPVTHLAGRTAPPPPFRIAHGTADCLVPVQQSQRLAEALRAAGGTVELTLLEGVGHAAPDFDATLMDPTIAWLGDVLGRGPDGR